MKYMPKKYKLKGLRLAKSYFCPCSLRDFKVKLLAKNMYLGGLGINFACSKLRVNTTFRRKDDPLEISQMLYILMSR